MTGVSAPSVANTVDDITISPLLTSLLLLMGEEDVHCVKVSVNPLERWGLKPDVYETFSELVPVFLEISAAFHHHIRKIVFSAYLFYRSDRRNYMEAERPAISENDQLFEWNIKVLSGFSLVSQFYRMTRIRDDVNFLLVYTSPPPCVPLVEAHNSVEVELPESLVLR